MDLLNENKRFFDILIETKPLFRLNLEIDQNIYRNIFRQIFNSIKLL